MANGIFVEVTPFYPNRRKGGFAIMQLTHVEDYEFETYRVVAGQEIMVHFNEINNQTLWDQLTQNQLPSPDEVYRFEIHCLPWRIYKLGARNVVPISTPPLEIDTCHEGDLYHVLLDKGMCFIRTTIGDIFTHMDNMSDSLYYYIERKEELPVRVKFKLVVDYIYLHGCLEYPVLRAINVQNADAVLEASIHW